jgi:hypothetical protein
VNAFIVDLEDKPGELARVTEAIAAKGIDLTGAAGATTAGHGVVVLLSNDEAGTRSALAAGGFSTREVEVVPAAIENKPGGLAVVARKLADAGVNVAAAFATGMSGDRITVAIATSDAAAARAALGDAVLTASPR